MRSIHIIFGLLAVYTVCSCIQLNEAVIFKMTNAVCKSYNSSWVTINTCRLKAIKRDKIVFNFNGTLLHKADDISLYYEIFKRLTGYKPWLIKGTTDVCRFLKSPYNPASKMIYNLYKNFTNFNSTCPLVGVHLVKDFYLRTDLMPLPLPTGDYMLTLRWSFNKKLQFDTNLFPTVIYRIN